MTKGVNLKLGAINTGGAAMSSYTRGMKGVQSQTRAVTTANRSMMKGMNANRRVVQQVGMQFSDLGVQIAGGQSAILSLTQNVPQVVQMFGAWGGILAALITFIGTFTLMMVRSGKSFSDMAVHFGVLEDSVQKFGEALSWTKEMMLDGVNLMVNNLDLLLSTAVVVAVFFTTKWAVAFIASSRLMRAYTMATYQASKGNYALAASIFFKIGVLGTLNKVLVTTTRLLKRFLPFAILAAVGYLAERLFTLKKATGSWGSALALVGQLAKEVFMQLPLLLGGVVLKVWEVSYNIVAAFTDMVAAVLDKISGIVDPFIGIFIGMQDAATEVWKSLGFRLSDETTKFLNNIIDKAREGANKLISIINGIPGIEMEYIDSDFGRITNDVVELQGTITERISKAFMDAFNGDYISKDGMIGELLGDGADIARLAADKFGLLGDAMLGSAADAIPAWQQIKDLLASVGDGSFEVRDMMGGKDKDKSKTDAVVKRLKNQVFDARIQMETLKSIISDAGVTSAFARMRDDINSIKMDPKTKTQVLSDFGAIEDRVKLMTPAVTAEVDKLNKLFDSGLQTIDPEAFFAATQEVVTNIQLLSEPIIAEVNKINALNPALKPINIDEFLSGAVTAINGVRTKTDAIRETVGEFYNLPPIKLPKLDITNIMKPAEKAISKLDELAGKLRDNLMDGIKGLVKGTKSMGDVVTGMLDLIIDRMMDMALNPLMDALFGKKGGSGGGIFGSVIGSIFGSFAGGGSTGGGARVGGIDGKGGRLAMLHPQETVVDHFQGQTIGAGGGGNTPVTIVSNNYFNGVTREEVMEDVENSQRNMEQRIDKKFPANARKNSFNQSRGMA
jgi:hypothetical protein